MTGGRSQIIITKPRKTRARNRTGRSDDRGPGIQQEPGPGFLRHSVAILFVVIAAIILPIFAHGCHGDDVDHEPCLAPFPCSSEAVSSRPSLGDEQE